MLTRKSIRGMAKKAWKRGYWSLWSILDLLDYNMSRSSNVAFKDLDSAIVFCKVYLPNAFEEANKEVTKHPYLESFNKAFYKASRSK